MTKDKQKIEDDKIVLTKQIKENEQISEDLKREQRKWQEQLEESSWQLKQQTDRITSLYQELAHFGDKTAHYNQEEIQDIYRNVQSVLRSQEETVESAYRKSSRQLEDTNERLYKERGALEW
ncbi:hypothetical protein [Candidatus Enterococcus lemimoniae]|uniref:DUF5082 domain-containing protein n=1 Tax=Candidatus Enterococcus lemimoniae TaxID=1834167 RepID=A0ABZ2T604_9ENTE|nr:hypothetical protein [Enterococcus sp. 12C11_DIV0727]OTO67932.1 hypothetical protein A5866_000127 [Enterococcus sp. 12C11_DIV0727]